MASTTRCIYTCPVHLECGPDLLLKCFERSDLYYKTHEVTRCKQPLYIFSCYFSLKWSCLVDCVSHTKEWNRSIETLHWLKKQTKKHCARIGSDRYRPILRIFWIGSDRIWKNGIVASLVFSSSSVSLMAFTFMHLVDRFDPMTLALLFELQEIRNMH